MQRFQVVYFELNLLPQRMNPFCQKARYFHIFHFNHSSHEPRHLCNGKAAGTLLDIFISITKSKIVQVWNSRTYTSHFD